MSRPVPVKPDNFFILLFNALRNRRVPIALRVVSHTLILLAVTMLAFVWIMGLQLRQATEQQAAAIGASLSRQAVVSATELLVANDRLSLNVMLDKLAQNPLVEHAALYGEDRRVIAEAGQRPAGDLPLPADGLRTFRAEVPREVARAELYLTLDLPALRQPMVLSLQNIGLLAAIVLAVALALSLRLGSRLSLPLLQLRLWLRDPVDIAPAQDRQDEIGDLARQLQARLGPDLPEPEEADPLAEGDDELFAALEGVLDERKPAPRVQPAPERPAAAPKPAARRARDPHADIEPDFELDFDIDLGLEGDDSPPLGEPRRPAPSAAPAPQATAARPRPAASRLQEDEFELDAADLGLDIDDLPPPAAPPRPATATAGTAAARPAPAAMETASAGAGAVHGSGRPAAAPFIPAEAVLPSVQSALLSIQIGDQSELRRLPRPRLIELLQRYRDCLDQASRLYHGSLYSLTDGGSLILFHSHQPGEDYLTRALCCGELLRALGHALQVEIADSGLTLHLQLGLSRGEDLCGLPLGELLEAPASRIALDLGRHSRNLLLLDGSLSADPQIRARARIRALASPPGASCVERLQEPLPARLEQQLGQMLRPG